MNTTVVEVATSSSPPQLDYNAYLILQALEKSRSRYRSVKSLSVETGLPAGTVKSVLDARNDLFRFSPLTSEDGTAIFTKSTTPLSFKEYLMNISRNK